ncbi:MAG: hypothetical protein V3T05_10035 [Myxococcota bacterium]
MSRQVSMPGLEPTSHGSVDADSAPVAGFEPTISPELDFTVERMPGLITNDEALGDRRIADEEIEEINEVPDTCRRCGAVYSGGRFCQRCGRTVLRGVSEKVEVVPEQVCLECSTPNPAGRVCCVACGARL